MSDETSVLANESAPSADQATGSTQETAADVQDSFADFSARYTEVLTKINSFLGTVDWGQMGRIGKGLGVLVLVIVGQVFIKGLLDTINVLPIVPGLLELLGVVVAARWCWRNLATKEKRSEVATKAKGLRQDYLG